MRTKHPNNKHFLWLTYTSEIVIKGQNLRFVYNSGSETLPVSSIHSIMFYGSTPPLTQDFLEICSKHEVPITIHRRNMPKAVWITPSFHTNSRDLLTKQITYRENATRQNYIARQLIKSKFKSTNWLIEGDGCALTKRSDVNHVRVVESIVARKYWESYFSRLGHPQWIRRGDNPISNILDAVSKYVAGILLRWVLYHNLSPHHGYLHVQTSYPALVYDIMDPYRGYFDLVVFRSIRNLKRLGRPETEWLPATIGEIKQFLARRVYTDATRQIVTVSELMHGIVLALRSYLIGTSDRFIIPTPGRPNGGRPIKAGYRLYGHQAGKTDFWRKAERITEQSLEKNALTPVA